MLEAAEEIQDAASTLREGGLDHDVYDKLDRSAAGIYRAYAAQDITIKALEAMAKALRVIDQRLGALVDAWNVGDVDVCGSVTVNGQGSGKPPLLPAPEKASAPLEPSAPAVRVVSTEGRRRDAPAFAALPPVKRQALFG